MGAGWSLVGTREHRCGFNGAAHPERCVLQALLLFSMFSLVRLIPGWFVGSGVLDVHVGLKVLCSSRGCAHLHQFPPKRGAAPEPGGNLE